MAHLGHKPSTMTGGTPLLGLIPPSPAWLPPNAIFSFGVPAFVCVCAESSRDYVGTFNVSWGVNFDDFFRAFALFTDTFTFRFGLCIDKKHLIER